MPISKQVALALVQEFVAEFPGAASIRFVLLTDARSFYEHFGEADGARAIAEWGDSPGAFRQSTRTAGFALENVDDPEAFKALLRHECLGHSGINSFEPAEKRALLDALIAARDQPYLSTWWAAVDDPSLGYAHLTDHEKAEELFCWACEEVGKRPLNEAAAEYAWQHQVLNRDEPLQLWGLGQIAESLAQGYRLNNRTQKTFPRSDRDQFRRQGDLPADALAQGVPTLGGGILLASTLDLRISPHSVPGPADRHPTEAPRAQPSPSSPRP